MRLFKKDEQTEEQKNIASKVLTMYKTSTDSMAAKRRKWDDCIKAYESEYFKKKLPDYKTQEISNYVFSTVETIIPLMLANDPKMLAMPKKIEAYQKSVNVQYALDHEWRRTDMFLKLIDDMKQGVIIGNAIIALLWNQNESRGIGEVTPLVISPFNFFVDPMATSIEDAEYCGYAAYKNVGEVIKQFPGKAEALRKAVTAVNDEYLAYGKKGVENSKNNVLYIECYLKDYSTEVSEVEEDGEKYKVTKLKYPNGRKIVLAGDVLLEDMENPYDDGFPYVMWKCNSVPGQFWAIGEIEMLLSPQEAMCSLMNSIIENAELTGNPIWVLDKNSGVEKNSLTNRKGLVVRKNPGTEVRRDAPPSMPAYIQNIIADLKNDMERVSGVFDVTRGEKPSGVTAAAAIQALNESAQGRIKLKVQTMEYMIGQLGSKWVRRMQQFWTVQRSIRITGEQYTPNSLQDVQWATIGNTQVGFKYIDKTDVDGDFDIVVIGGSTMPVNKTARFQQLLQLAQTQAEDGLPMIDRRTLLENADLGNVDEIIQRVSNIKGQQGEEQQMQMEQEQMAMQQQAEQEEALRQKQVQEEEISKEADHQRELEKIGVEANISSLQNNEKGVQSELGGDDLQSMVVKLLQTDPSKLVELAKDNPQILQLLELIAEQSNGNSVKEGK
jgi:hypothetical protein